MIRLSPRIQSLLVWSVRIALTSFLAWYCICLVPTGDGGRVRDVSFPAGSGVRRLAAELKNAGIIRSAWHFVLVARLRGASHRLKAGDYRFSDAMGTGAILRKVVNGEVDYRRFTLPEGYSIYQAAELLEQKGYFGREEFLKGCADPELLKRLGIAGETVEGYLYPATYDLPRSASAADLIGRMVARFDAAYAEAASGVSGKGLSRSEAVTLASIIEKEAVSPEEKPLISSVFHNRLRTGMPLQSDPTAVYGVRAFAGKVTREDVRRPSPYNTYLIKGLPPGPIGNPGSGALRAALAPATSDYLYFVARQDGTHQFSRTLDEHNRAVARFLKN